MTETVLVPIDGSDPAEAALAFALDHFPDAHLVVYHAINPLTVASEVDAGATSEEFWSAVIEEAESRAAEILADAEERVAPADREIELDAEVGPAATNVVECVDERDVDRVVIGSHGRTGLERAVLGSVAEKVVRRASVPVTVVEGEAA